MSRGKAITPQQQEAIEILLELGCKSWEIARQLKLSEAVVKRVRAYGHQTRPVNPRPEALAKVLPLLQAGLEPVVIAQKLQCSQSHVSQCAKVLGYSGHRSVINRDTQIVYATTALAAQAVGLRLNNIQKAIRQDGRSGGYRWAYYQQRILLAESPKHLSSLSVLE